MIYETSNTHSNEYSLLLSSPFVDTTSLFMDTCFRSFFRAAVWKSLVTRLKGVLVWSDVFMLCWKCKSNCRRRTESCGRINLHYFLYFYGWGIFYHYTWLLSKKLRGNQGKFSQKSSIIDAWQLPKHTSTLQKQSFTGVFRKAGLKKLTKFSE